MLFSFLTTDANAEVGAVHEKAMPVCLLTEADRETWMRGAVEDALALQRPALDGTIRVVATGPRQDG
jgi:putative SOS response-associated peptidase YedK